jgi:uncharacterized spore protein YtfJ
MSSAFDNMLESVNKYQEQGHAWMEKLLAAARPSAVFGAPVVSGSYTVITSSEVTAGGGFGYGVGGGSAPASSSDQTPSEEQANSGGGGGLGGGGGSSGRPVAAIIIGPEGVRVEPVVDVTKIALAAFTTAGAMLMMLGRMRKMSRR